MSLRLGRVSATGKQDSFDATAWTLRKEDSAQQGVSSLPHGKIKMGRPRGNKTNHEDWQIITSNPKLGQREHEDVVEPELMC